MPLPASRAARIALGGALIVGGIAGFLPILGFWMLPLGLLVLSVDLAIVRRHRRRAAVWWARRQQARAAARAAAGAGAAPPPDPGSPARPD
jgi:purine-cytosine permease-like protein